MTDLTGFLGQISTLPDIFVGELAGQAPATFDDLPRMTMIDQLRSIFAQQGLPASLADWAYSAMVAGVTGTELTHLLYERPEFRTRFQALFDYRKNFPDLPAIGPSEVIAYERQGSQLMRSAGMPPGFYDHWSDFVSLIANNTSMDDLSQRISQGFERVQTLPRTVREAYASFFGPSGDAALAAHFLDPTKALPVLRQQVAAAEVAGAGFNFGFTLGRDRAMEAASAGFDFASARDRFANLAQMRPLFNETVGESAAADLSAEDEGAKMAFGLEGGDQAGLAIEARRKQRVADFAGGGGSTGTPQLGSRGLGAARP